MVPLCVCLRKTVSQLKIVFSFSFTTLYLDRLGRNLPPPLLSCVTLFFSSFPTLFSDHTDSMKSEMSRCEFAQTRWRTHVYNVYSFSFFQVFCIPQPYGNLESWALCSHGFLSSLFCTNCGYSCIFQLAVNSHFPL